MNNNNNCKEDAVCVHAWLIMSIPLGIQFQIPVLLSPSQPHFLSSLLPSPSLAQPLFLHHSNLPCALQLLLCTHISTWKALGLTLRAHSSASLISM